MNLNNSQFSEHLSGKLNPPKKFKGTKDSNPYTQLNQMLDYQIKQAKLELIKKKNDQI